MDLFRNTFEVSSGFHPEDLSRTPPEISCRIPIRILSEIPKKTFLGISPRVPSGILNIISLKFPLGFFGRLFSYS